MFFPLHDNRCYCLSVIYILIKRICKDTNRERDGVEATPPENESSITRHCLWTRGKLAKTEFSAKTPLLYQDEAVPQRVAVPCARRNAVWPIYFGRTDFTWSSSHWRLFGRERKAYPLRVARAEAESPPDISALSDMPTPLVQALLPSGSQFFPEPPTEFQ